MAYIETFDEFESTENLSDYKHIKPFAHRDDKTEKGTFDWLIQNFDFLEKKAQSRLISYQRWHALYKGIHWRHLDTRDYHRNIEFTEKKPRMVDNIIHEHISTLVSNMALTNSNFTAIPWNNDQSDKNNAKSCELLLKARAKAIDFDKLQRDADMYKFLYGTVFTFVKWDEETGPLHPSYQKIKNMYKGGIPKKVLKKLKKDNIKVGDVAAYNKTPDRVFPEEGPECWSKVKHLDEIEWVHIEDLKAEYPNKDIKENQRNYYNYSTNEISKPNDQVMVRHFYHKPTKHLPEGAYIKYCDSCILEWTHYPFSHADLPIIVDRDIEVPNHLWGRPRITNIEQMQRHYNNIESSQARDLGVGSAPKWMVPKGSAEFRSLNNEFTIVEYKGAVAPQLISSNPMSMHGIEKQKMLQDRMAKHMKIFPVMEGKVPAGVTANSALRFLDEQNSQAMEADVRKRKSRIRKTYSMMAQIMGQYYRPNDGRVVRTLGQNNEYLIKDLQKADFTQVYDVELQNTSSLPDTKTGKIATIVDINATTQDNPVFKRKEVVELLDLGLDDAFVDLTTASTNCAEAIFEMLLNGEQAPEPQKHDDLLIYYSVMYKRIQDVSFKMYVDPANQAKVFEYLKTIEYLLSEKAKMNQKVALELANLDYYPSFFTLPEPLPLPEGNPEAGADLGAMENTEKTIDAAIKQESEQ